MNINQNEGRDWAHLVRKKVRSKYLIKQKNYLDSIGYIPNKKDLEFLEEYKQYYEWNKRQKVNKECEKKIDAGLEANQAIIVGE